MVVLKRIHIKNFRSISDATIDLDDFNLVICKPDRKVIYSGCQWSSLSEHAEVGGMVLEEVQITATRRYETGA